MRERCVLGGDAEAAGGDLLDARVALRAEARGILAALPAVRARAEPVERRRDRLVRLGRERAVGHAAGGEAPHDRLRGLDLLERNRNVRRDELQQIAHLHRLAAVDERCEPLVRVPASRPCRASERVRGVDDVGVRRVRLSALAELDVAGILQPRPRRSGGARALDRLALEVGERRSADGPRRPRERRLDERPVETERVEDLRAAVARDVRDAHLRHHLQDAVLDRLLEAELGLDRIGTVAADAVGLRQRRDRLDREPRADRLGAVAE